MNKQLISEAIVLAGGLGTRLRSVVSDRPKVMAQVAGAPFLSWIIKALKRNGVTRVVLSVGYLHEQIVSYFGEIYEGVEVVYSVESEPRGTGGGLLLASDMLKSDTFLVLNGDSWCATSLVDFQEWHFSNKSNSSVLLAQVDNVGRYGSVDVSEDGVIRQFLEKSNSSEPGWINGGIYIFERSILEKFKQKLNHGSIEKDILPELVRDNSLLGFKANCPFIDIGTPESFLASHGFVTNFV